MFFEDLDREQTEVDNITESSTEKICNPSIKSKLSLERILHYRYKSQKMQVMSLNKALRILHHHHLQRNLHQQIYQKWDLCLQSQRLSMDQEVKNYLLALPHLRLQKHFTMSTDNNKHHENQGKVEGASPLYFTEGFLYYYYAKSPGPVTLKIILFFCGMEDLRRYISSLLINAFRYPIPKFSSFKIW